MVYNIHKLRKKWIDYVDAGFTAPQVSELCVLMETCHDYLLEQIEEGDISNMTVVDVCLMALPMLYGHMVNDLTDYNTQDINNAIERLKNRDHKIDIENLLDMAIHTHRRTDVDDLFPLGHTPTQGEIEVELSIETTFNYIRYYGREM